MAERSRTKQACNSILKVDPQPQDLALGTQMMIGLKSNRKRKRVKKAKTKNDIHDKSDLGLSPMMDGVSTLHQHEYLQSFAPLVPSHSSIAIDDCLQRQLYQQAVHGHGLSEDQESFSEMATLRSSMLKLQENLLLMEIENRKDLKLMKKENMMIKKLMTLVKQYPDPEMIQSIQLRQQFKSIEQSLIQMKR